MAHYFVNSSGKITKTNKKKKTPDVAYSVSADGKVTEQNIAPVRTTGGGGKRREITESNGTVYKSTNKNLENLLTVSGREDFKSKSGYVTTKSEGFWDKLGSKYGMGFNDLQYEYINNQNDIRKEIDSKAVSWGSDTGKTTSSYKEKALDYMTSDEVAVYNYYYQTEGKDKAEEFLDELAETLNARKAGKDFSSIKGNTTREILYGVVAGAEQFEQGVKNAGNMIVGKDDYIPQTSTQILTGMIREDLADDGFNVLGASLGQVGFDALSTGTNMVPSIAAGMANPLLGASIMGVSAAGNAYQEDLNESGDKTKSKIYATTIGALEGTLQYALGGIGKLGGVSPTLNRAVSGIKNGALRFAAEYGGKIGSEAFEEGLQNVLGTVVKNAIHGTDEKVNWEEVAYDAFLGGLMGGVFGATEVAGTHLSENEQAVVDKVYKDAVAEAEKDGKVSNKKKNEIYENVLKQMEKGYIDTDTIESALGGETYRNYKSITNMEETLKDEIKRLENDPRPFAQNRVEEARNQLKQLEESTKKAELKDLLSNKVEVLTRGSRLGESYREIERRSQRFEADLTKYDEKTKATIQRAINSGILNNTNRTHEFVDMIAKLSTDKGVSFDFTNNENLKKSGFALEGKTINGLVKDGNIILNIDSKKALNTIVGHEITHVLEGTELYAELQKAVKEYATTNGDYEARFQALSELYKNVEGADIEAEITADLVGDYLFTDADFVTNLHAKKPNVFKKIFEEIKYLCKVATAGSKEARQLEKVKRTFEKAYAESSNLEKTTKYALSRNDDMDYNKYWSHTLFEQVTRRYYDTKQKNVFVNDYVNYYEVEVLEDGTYEIKNVISIDGNEDLIKALQERRRKYANSNGRRPGATADGVGHTGELNDRNNVATEREQSWAEFIDEILEKYGTDKPNGISNSEEGARNSQGNKVQLSNEASSQDGVFFDAKTEILPNTKRGASVAGQMPTNMIGAPRTMSIADLVNGVNIYDYDMQQNVSYSSTDIKYSLADSDGKQLTEEQQEYFKDSKVRDENGNLKVMYHGSPAQFTMFDKKKAKSSGYYGRGFYFTNSSSHAGQYGNQYEVYLNIANPLQQGTSDISKEQLRKFVEAIAENEDDYGLDNYGYDATVDSVTDSVYGKDDFSMIMDINASCVGDLVEAIQIFNEVNGTNYDGIVVPTETVAFYPEQIKSIDNKTPTSAPDIRYSMGDQATSKGNYNVYGKDIALETAPDIPPAVAPIAETATRADVSLDAEPTVATTDTAPDSAPIAEPIRKEVTIPKEKSDAEPIAKVLTEEPAPEKKRSRFWSQAAELTLDKGFVFENLSKKTKNRDLEAKWNYIRYADSKAQDFIGEGAEGVKSLNDIKKDVESAGLTQEVYEYVYHLHNIDRMSLADRFENGQNKAVFGDSVTPDVSRKIVAELEAKHPEVKKFANEIYSVNNYLRNLLVEGGVISQETADLWAEMYPHYVPIRRAGDHGLNINVPLDTGRTGINAPVKRATGGSSDIMPLFDTMAQRALQTYKAVAKNSFGVELKNALGTTVGTETADVDSVIDGLDQSEELLQKGKNGRKPTFTVFEGGEKVTFEITEDMYDALKPTSETLAYTNKVANTVSNLHRGVLTEYNPAFLASNIIKDVQDVLINSQHPAKTYANFPKAMKEMAKKGKWYKEYLKNGGEQNSYFDKKTNTFEKDKSGFVKAVGMPLNAISIANNYIERLPRLAEYIASREAGRSIEVSMLDSARVTTNFAAGGDITKFANRNGATFLNASVQGVMQQVRNVREAKMNGLKGWSQLAAKYAVAGLPAILLNSLLWDDDEEYKNLSDYVKQNYYIVAKYGDGKFVRIPKGRMLAIIQDAIEQTVNTATGNDEADWRSFSELLFSNLAPNNPIEDNILAPIIQAKNNTTWYGDDLVPTRLQDLPAAEQFDETTDSISRWLGEKTNISPYKINYLLDQYTGGLGDTVLPMLTPEAENGEDTLAGKLLAPIRDKFTTDSVLKNQNVSDFYDTSDTLTTNAKASGATDKDVLSNKYINAVKTEIGELYAEKRAIQSGNLSDSEKYYLVREIQKKINKLTENALSEYENVNIDGDYATVGDRQYRKTDTGWTKITDDQLEKQDEVTSGLGISPAEYWSDKDEYDFAHEYSEKYSFFQKNGITYDDYKSADEDGKRAYSWAYENPGKYTMSKAITDDYMTYYQYKSELSDIKADKDADGKSIAGSAKEKKIEYINNLDLDYGQKIILFRSLYDSKEDKQTYNGEILEYLNSREDLTTDEIKTILEELDFKVYDDGRVEW